MASIRLQKHHFPTPEARRKFLTAQANDYKRRTQKIILMNFSKLYDPEVIQWLEDNKPYNTAVKWLIREQIKREEQEKLSDP